MILITAQERNCPEHPMEVVTRGVSHLEKKGKTEHLSKPLSPARFEFWCL